MSAFLDSQGCRHFLFLSHSQNMASSILEAAFLFLVFFFFKIICLMKIVVALVAMLSVAAVVVVWVVKSGRIRMRHVRKIRIPLFAMAASFLNVLLDLLASGVNLTMEMVALDLFPSALTLWLWASFLSRTFVVKEFLLLMIVLNPAVAAFHLARMLLGFCLLSRHYLAFVVSVIALLAVIVLISGFFARLRNVKTLMRDGTLWGLVCVIVDASYFGFMVMAVLLVNMGLAWGGVLMIASVISAVGWRIFNDSKFIVWQKQELLIVETMKLIPLTSAPSHIDEVYKELYERIVVYFETKKPYLNSSLSINDMVRHLYSNKLYISKAISKFTGRNFCQFVNYYRVMHSVECFRRNQDIRVHEMAEMSGFNSVVSYCMAFRLFMGETPSEWCRKERSRLLKKGK